MGEVIHPANLGMTCTCFHLGRETHMNINCNITKSMRHSMRATYSTAHVLKSMGCRIRRRSSNLGAIPYQLDEMKSFLTSSVNWNNNTYLIRLQQVLNGGIYVVSLTQCPVYSGHTMNDRHTSGEEKGHKDINKRLQETRSRYG